MGIKQIIKDAELGDLVKHSLVFIGSTGLTNQICKYINESPSLSDDKKKLYTNTIRGGVITGNFSYYLGEKFFDTKEDYTLFAKTVVTGVTSLTGAVVMATLSKYASRHENLKEKDAEKQ